MMNACRMARAAALLGVLGASQSATAADAAAPVAALAPPDCWVDHVQVQPSLVRQTSEGKLLVGAAFGPTHEQHPGAEHITKAQKTPCKTPSSRADLNSGFVARLPSSK